MAIEPQATPQPPDGLPIVEPVQHVRLTPAWVDPHGEAPNFWLLEVPGAPGETAEMRMMISERRVVEMLVTFARTIFYGENRAPVEAALRLAAMSLLGDTDWETIEALRALLLERASKDGGL